MNKHMHSYAFTLFAPESEFEPEFVRAMANRMSISFHKYGYIADAHSTCDHVASLKQRLALYEETGNTEWLADVANFAMCETMKKGQEAFRATDSDESPGRTRADGTVDAERNLR